PGRGRRRLRARGSLPAAGRSASRVDRDRRDPDRPPRGRATRERFRLSRARRVEADRWRWQVSTPRPGAALQPNGARPEPIPPGTENCGCCQGVESDTPVRIFNRAGLSAIAYRIGAYTQFRASLHAGLSTAELAPLANLRTRDDDDFTIGLLD